MTASFKTPPTSISTWLRPGQRFRSPDGGSESELTVSRLVQDTMGLTHAVLRDNSGREISMFADQIQFAIEVGMLSPMETTMVGPAC